MVKRYCIKFTLLLCLLFQAFQIKLSERGSFFENAKPPDKIENTKNVVV